MAQSHNVNQPLARRLRPWLGWFVAAALAALMIVFLFASSRNKTTAEPVIPPGTQLTSWTNNGRGGQYVLQILDGQAPPAGMTVSAIVATDSDCDPDAEGFNHCHNIINLPGGGRITVIDNHVMQRYRCLRPGEPILLKRINAAWVMGAVE